MTGGFLRREWGAVTFVLAVLIGIVVVPIALYLGNHGSAPAAPAPAAISTPAAPVSPSPAARP